jgi:Polysaccharide deacetylase
MICLTGDLHHSSLGTGNQKHCDITELQVAKRYLKMLEEAKVKVTFFISGKCFEEEWDDTKIFCENPLVEVGGHNYTCFQCELFHRICKKITGSYNGPPWVQQRDARKTIDIIKAKTGRTIQSWRNHMYMHGPYTEKVLSQCGIHTCSDGVKKNSMGPEWHSSGIMNFPLNIIPDHEHLYHAERTPEWVEWWSKRYNWSDDFGSQSYYVEEWTDIVLEGLRNNKERGAISNMIIHPITLYLCDRLKSFERILEYLEQHETLFMNDIYNLEIDKRESN